MPKPVGFKTSRWKRDPFARGSYSSSLMGSTDREWYDLARPASDALYFAGEHTNYDGRHQSLDGAYNTGTREAERIAARPWNVNNGVKQESFWANPRAKTSGWGPSEPVQAAGVKGLDVSEYGSDTVVEADASLYKVDRETKRKTKGGSE